jgi:hypothetical protein
VQFSGGPEAFLRGSRCLGGDNQKVLTETVSVAVEAAGGESDGEAGFPGHPVGTRGRAEADRPAGGPAGQDDASGP